VSDINYLGVLVAAVSTFVLGGFWYSPAAFLKPWLRASGVDPDAPKEEKHGPMVFGLAFLASLVAAGVFAYALGPLPTLEHALSMGAMIGLGWVAMSFGTNYAFGGRSLILWLIDAGYHAVQFLIFGLILGLWH
jgi:hypothetical protein